MQVLFNKVQTLFEHVK